MKLKFIVFSAAVLFFLLGCSNEPQEEHTENETTEITQEEIISAYSLQKGKISASSAAKKINNNPSSNAEIKFDSKKIISYDDKTGFFCVELKGKKAGKSFSEKLEFQGFSHPAVSTPKYLIKKKPLDLSFAIEENLSLTNFIAKIKDAPHKYLDFSIRLENDKEIPFAAQSEDYVLKAEITEKDGKIKINPKYFVKYLSLENSEAPEKEEFQKVPPFAKAFDNFYFEYFTKSDVFKYVQDKVKDSIIKVYPNKFASEFYALAQIADAPPASLFNTEDGTLFKKYSNVYSKDGGRFKFELEAAIKEPKNGGIKADDYEGKITVNFYIKEKNTLPENLSALEPVKVSKEDYKKITKEFIEEKFKFELKKYSDSDKIAQKWQSLSINNKQLLSQSGVQIKYEPENSTFNASGTKLCYLLLNNEQDLSKILACKNNLISETSGYSLVVKNIFLNKKAGEKELKITFGLLGNAQNPYEVLIIPPEDQIDNQPPVQETTEITQEEIISAYSLQKGKISASSAAKKINNNPPSNAEIKFDSKKIISYDDKTGFFCVELKGKKAGKSFSEKLEFQGFSHPAVSTPKYLIKKKPLDLSFAIEENLSLTNFIAKIKDAPHKYLDFSIRLENNKEIPFAAQSEDYVLKAEITEKDGKIKINPKYFVKYLSLENSEAPEKEEFQEILPFAKAFDNFYFEYFTKKDAFCYIQEKLKDDIIKVYPNKFASEFYARAQIFNAPPASLFNTEDGTLFKKYSNVYSKAGGHFNIQLEIAIAEPRNGGIKADDYEGKITVNFYVQSIDVIGGEAVEEITAIEITKTGYKKITEEFIGENFGFSLMKNLQSDKIAEDWKKLPIKNKVLIKEKIPSPLEYEVTNNIQFKYFNKNLCYLVLNGVKDMNTILACKDGILSESNGYSLVITNILLNKKSDEEKLKITLGFLGNTEKLIDIYIAPPRDK